MLVKMLQLSAMACIKSSEVGNPCGFLDFKQAQEEKASQRAQIKEMEEGMAKPMADDELAALLERYGNAQEEFEHRGGYDLETRAQTVLTGLGIG